ncbi:MAG: phage tail assembly protein [Chthonomonadaceae bacterium]|nr:phage tail assembly protein [Chthonomonadaceae bacterium]
MLFSLSRLLRRQRMKVVQSFGRGASRSTLRLSLCDINADMTDAWLDSFFGVEAVEILQGDLLETGADAVVSPANSFGDMSGGVDKRIDDFYRGAAQEAIVRCIGEQFLGELPVGMALVVSMPNSRLPFVIAAPTMRTPVLCTEGLRIEQFTRHLRNPLSPRFHAQHFVRGTHH